MKKFGFKEIKDNGLLLYEYIRGSQAQGTSLPNSDTDTGGIYLAPIEQLLGLGFDYQDEIKSEKNDDCWMELNKFMRLLLKSNPTVLEALFVDEEFVLYEHPIITELKKHRDIFLTKECFKPFYGYGVSQILKARGLNKKIVQPMVERKTPMDFCYTFYKQGSTKMQNWLDYRGLKQNYCGLVNIPNMGNTIGVYYDWGNHFLNENFDTNCVYGIFYQKNGYVNTTDIIAKIKNTSDENELVELNKQLDKVHLINMVIFISKIYGLKTHTDFYNWYKEQKAIGYKGILNEAMTSNEIRLSSVSKGEFPICYMTYNKDAYQSHCRDYKEYKDWEKNRNPIRYESNLNHSFDGKNLSHSFRLVHMCIEIARGEGMKVNRKNIDRDFLLDVRNHKYEYEELIEKLDNEIKEMEEAIKASTIPTSIDAEIVNKLLLGIRKKQLGIC
jgi:hypothetical protein